MSGNLKKLLIAGLLALLISGCSALNSAERIEEIHNELIYLQKDEPAPYEGWLVPPKDLNVLYFEATRCVDN